MERVVVFTKSTSTPLLTYYSAEWFFTTDGARLHIHTAGGVRTIIPMSEILMIEATDCAYLRT